ncbi:MAG: sporulation protein YunB [Oscillospiraceae bacterium]|jgi:sporulation protein YunB
MPIYTRQRPRRPYRHRKHPGRLLASALVASLLFMLFSSYRYFRELSASIGMSDASDLVIDAINTAVLDIMEEENYSYKDFVMLNTAANGEITAMTTNTILINRLAAEILQQVSIDADCGSLNVSVPIGNLTGSSLLLGKGPNIEIEVIVLTSSYATVENRFTDCGINQTKHQLFLDMTLDIDILIPLQTLSTRVTQEILIAETIIVGEVPQMFVNTE